MADYCKFQWLAKCVSLFWCIFILLFMIKIQIFKEILVWSQFSWKRGLAIQSMVISKNASQLNFFAKTHI
jgi:hypothetical protein